MNSQYNYNIIYKFYEVLHKDYNEINEESKNKIINNIRKLNFDKLNEYYEKNKKYKLLNLDYVIKKICKNNNILLKRNINIPHEHEQEILWKIISLIF